MQIRSKSRQIISQSDVWYHFKIIHGPSLEDILGFSCREINKSFGFELAPASEPTRSRHYDDVVVENRGVMSYFLVPSVIRRIYDVSQEKQFNWWKWEGGEESRIEILNEFQKQESKEIFIEAIIYKEPRGHAYAYFGGGITASFGTKYEIEMVYNYESRTGTLKVKETE